MTEFTEEKKFVQDNIETTRYRERIEELETKLHDLRNDLADVEIEILQEKGYKPINMENITVMAPVGMSLRQLYTALQQMSPPNEDSERAVKNLVTEEDRSSVHEHEDYQAIVEERQDIIDSVMDVYRDFWREEVESVAETDEQKVSYMMLGLEKNIRARKLCEITGVSEYECRKYDFTGDELTKR